MEPTSLSGDGFEDVLGPASRRYFGTGYRRTTYSFDRFEADASTGSAVAEVRYPESWSTKTSAARLVPHLSTIDAAILSTRMAEAILAAAAGLDADQIGRAWVRTLSIRSGPSPVETLDEVPLEARVVSTEEHEGLTVTGFEQRIGSMVVSSSVVHEPGAGNRGRPGTDVWPAGPMTELFRATGHRSTIEHLDLAAGMLICRHSLEPRAANAIGLESAFWPAPTLVDCLVLAGQMAQVLIYETDRIDRDATSTLWMRRAGFTATSPAERAMDSTAKMSIIARQAVHRNGRTVNSVRVTMPSLFGVSVDAALGYFGSAPTSAG